MNLLTAINQHYSKNHVAGIVATIGTDEVLFAELMHLFLGDDYRTTQRASWVMSHVVDAQPQLLVPYLEAFIHNLTRPNLPQPVKRNTIRQLQFIAIPEALQGIVTELCFGYISSPTEPAATKAFAITVLEKLCKSHPDLLTELKWILEERFEYEGPAFRSRAKKILQTRISRISTNEGKIE